MQKWSVASSVYIKYTSGVTYSEDEEVDYEVSERSDTTEQRMKYNLIVKGLLVVPSERNTACPLELNNVQSSRVSHDFEFTLSR